MSKALDTVVSAIRSRSGAEQSTQKCRLHTVFPLPLETAAVGRWVGG